MKKWNIANNTFESYLLSCKSAALNENRFNNFKRDDGYTSVLEHQHLTKDFGDFIINHFSPSDLNLISSIYEKLSENDKFGNPIVYDYSIGKFSISTLKYIKNSLDIISYFKDCQIKNVVEIGGGYGGLCKTLSNFTDIDKYYIFDLDQVNLLIDKYLSKFELKFEYIVSSLNEVSNFSPLEIDLLISNYAISELPRSLQLTYIDRIVSKSKKFFIIYNHLQSGFEENGMSFYEFCEILSVDFHIEIRNDIDNDVVKVLYGKNKSSF